MIYKVQSAKEYNVLQIINKLQDNFDMIYYNNTLYVAIKNISEEENCEQLLKKYFKPNKFFLFIKIDENNLKNENQIIVEWCKNIFIKIDTQRFEKENQEKMREYLKSIEKLDEVLKQEELKKGG